MKIALAQINPTVGDFRGNRDRILEFAERAAQSAADLVIFPELAICGYPPADLLEKASFLKAAQSSLQDIQQWTAVPGRPAVLVGSVEPSGKEDGKSIRNVAVLLQAGQVIAVQAKVLLPFYDVFDEQRYFEPAAGQHLAAVRLRDGREATLAITICEDAWNDKAFWPRRRYQVDPVERLMEAWEARRELREQPRLILNLSASPYWQGKRQVRQHMLGALAARHGAVVAMCNQAGGNDSLIFDGSSLAIHPSGRVLAQAASFTEDLLSFDSEAQALPDPPVEDEDDLQATWDALVLGTRDYLHKCGFRKALVGLSGGIDSALVAAVAVEALGPENVMGVGMPSEYSSEGSRDDARDLAENLGIRFELLPIHGVFAADIQALEPLFQGTVFGLAEENLQARIRGTLLMAISNKFGALVLTTGNKSEMSVGYCTLYGDMVGGLAVLGDVWKTRVYRLCHWLNRHRGEVIPVTTLTKPPSAELRPGQMDTDSLPPYEVLDPILEAYVERFCSAAEIARQQGIDLPLVQSILRLVEHSEYKRQQAAPVLKVTKKAFGMGRRFPIAVKVEI